MLDDFRSMGLFSLAELSSFMQCLFEADLRLKSSAEPRIVLEKVFLEICLRSPKRRFQPPGAEA